jgi:hypothetical protein
MLVMNCCVDESKLLASSSGENNQQKAKNKGTRTRGQGIAGQAIEQFHPVTCEVCGTEVGVRDADEVYHFFHVFPSNA